MHILKRFWPIIFLLIASGLLCIANFTPNTFLSGWDTLHPEFNFGLNIGRTLFGVFRTEQGLGAVAAHSHMADLPRILILYLEHFVLPINFLRYSYIFLNIILGPIGMYLFLQKHLLKNKIASFLGGLFYLLNLGTMQIFNVPFEMFTTLFATLPFIFLFATSFLQENNNRVKNLLLFSIFVLFTSPSAYAATLWYVFFGSFTIFIFSFILVNKLKLKDGFILFGIILLLNLFWLAPNIYFVLFHAKEVQNANINLLFSDQAFLKNKEFGNITSLLFLKSFYFDWSVYSGNNNFTQLLSPFIQYLKNVPVMLTGLGIGLSLISGLVYFIKKTKKQSVPFIVLLLVSLFFLINQNFPFSHLFKLLQDHLPYFKEALRFPDDKILNIYVFLASIFFGYFCLLIIEKLSKKSISVFALAVVLILSLYNLPSFTGNFINKAMRVNIPNEYFQMFDYLSTQPSESKVANFPINSPWGWVYYDWYKDKPSFQGAGFLYFSIKQPLLDRDFDRWSPYNESYYREMSNAIYSKNETNFSNVILKYKIGYIFIDRNVTSPQHPKSTLFFDESEKLLENSTLLREKKQFGKITLYRLNSTQTNIEKFSVGNINVSPATKTSYLDVPNEKLGNYITTKSGLNFTNVYFPFRDLVDNQSRVNQNVIRVDNEKITFDPHAKNIKIDTYNLLPYLNIIPSDLIVELNNSALALNIYPNVPILDQTPLARPLKGLVDIRQNSSNLVLSVNENQIFNLNKLTANTPFALGKINLKNNGNIISVYDKSGFIPIENTVEIISPFFGNCQDQTPVSALLSGSKIDIKGKGDLCVLIPLGFFPSDNAKSILTNFGFEANTDTKIRACLFSQVTSQCLYYIDAVKNTNTYNFSFPILAADSNKMAIKIFFENRANQNLTLSNFTSSYSPSIADISISALDLQSILPQNQSLTFNKMYLSSNVIYDPGFNIANLNKLSNDCGLTNQKIKKELINIKGQDLIKYTTNNGTFCDHYSYPNLSHNTGYLVVVNSLNSSGLPLTMCLTNYTSRKCDIYTILSYNKSLKNEIFLLPPTDTNGIGYDVNLESLGIKGSPSVNYLKTIEFIPIPYDLLSGISKTISNSNNSFDGQVTGFKRFNPDMYLINTNNKPMILNLNYSYEPGFKAYIVSCKSDIECFLKTLIAPIFDKEVSHVLVNNWSNGWILTSEQQVAIVFIPQYLEWLGFVIIIAVFTSLLIKVKK